jgi:hypothetical protein
MYWLYLDKELKTIVCVHVVEPPASASEGAAARSSQGRLDARTNIVMASSGIRVFLLNNALVGGFK